MGIFIKYTLYFGRREAMRKLLMHTIDAQWSSNDNRYAAYNNRYAAYNNRYIAYNNRHAKYNFRYVI